MTSQKLLVSDDRLLQIDNTYPQIGSIVSISSIPDELKRLDQWALWKGELNTRGKITKPPYRADDPYDHASINETKTFSSFQTAVDSLIEHEAYLQNLSEAQGCPEAFGLIFAITEQDNIVGVDLDDVIDKETGDIKSFALNVIEHLSSYTERSPSGTGIRIFAKGKLPGTALNREIPEGGSIEMYDRGHFLSVTGDVFR